MAFSKGVHTMFPRVRLRLAHFCNPTCTKDGLREVLNGQKTSTHRLTDGHQSGACGLAVFPLAALRPTDRKDSPTSDGNPHLQ